MADRVFCLVEMIALPVIKLTEPEYSRELLGILSADLSQIMITDGNMNQTIARINFFRRKKEDAFIKIMGLDFDWEDKPKKRKRMWQMVGNFSGKLNPEQVALKRQIKFLSNLSRSIYELKFIRK